MSACVTEWAGLITIRVQPLTSDQLLEQVNAGLFALGLGWGHLLMTEPDERLELFHVIVIALILTGIWITSRRQREAIVAAPD